MSSAVDRQLQLVPSLCNNLSPVNYRPNIFCLGDEPEHLMFAGEALARGSLKAEKGRKRWVIIFASNLIWYGSILGDCRVLVQVLIRLWTAPAKPTATLQWSLAKPTHRKGNKTGVSVFPRKKTEFELSARARPLPLFTITLFFKSLHYCETGCKAKRHAVHRQKSGSSRPRASTPGRAEPVRSAQRGWGEWWHETRLTSVSVGCGQDLPGDLSQV